MAIVRWDPFRDLMGLQDDLNRLFRQGFFRGSGEGSKPAAAWVPSIDVYEREGKLVVEAELPGMSAEDIDISIDDRVLTVKGERTFTDEVKEEHYHRMERAYGSFERRIALPRDVNIDDIHASVTDGVLEVEMPEMEEVKPKKIPIKVEGSEEK
ncbi:MAG: Hsp20/alpha crystallin family protein [Actinomycetota bacterium]|nr:Hsp20/alpha crystallin family protein [Actinomycetota bacterium]